MLASTGGTFLGRLRKVMDRPCVSCGVGIAYEGWECPVCQEMMRFEEELVAFERKKIRLGMRRKKARRAAKRRVVPRRSLLFAVLSGLFPWEV